MKPFDLMCMNSDSIDQLAVSIKAKLSAGDWWDFETLPPVGKLNSTAFTTYGAGSVSSGTGKSGNAADFVPNALYSSNSIPFTASASGTYAIGCWINLDAIAVVPSVAQISEFNNATASKKGLQLLLLTDGTFIARAGDSGSGLADATTPASAVSTGSYVFLQAERGSNYVRCRVNNGSWYSTSITPSSCPTASQIIGLGGDMHGGTAQNCMDGRLDSAFALKGTLTDSEWDWLYNGGSGRTFADF